MIILLLLATVGVLVVFGMLAAGDLRLTRKAQQEWEDRFSRMTPEELEQAAQHCWKL